MQIDVKNLERKFYSQKVRLLKKLESVEKKKRAQFSAIANELNKYRKREELLKKIESQVSAHLKQLSRKIEYLRRQDLYDKKRINELMGEMKRLKRDVPKLESTIKKLRPQKVAIAGQYRNFSQKLDGVSKKIMEIEKKRSNMQSELASLLEKERMLRQGRIYWAAIQSTSKEQTGKKSAKPESRPKTKTKRTGKVKKRENQSFLGRLLIRKK